MGAVSLFLRWNTFDGHMPHVREGCLLDVLLGVFERPEALGRTPTGEREGGGREVESSCQEHLLPTALDRRPRSANNNHEVAVAEQGKAAPRHYGY